jgi:hypothetical protein
VPPHDYAVARTVACAVIGTVESSLNEAGLKELSEWLRKSLPQRFQKGVPSCNFLFHVNVLLPFVVYAKLATHGLAQQT